MGGIPSKLFGMGDGIEVPGSEASKVGINVAVGYSNIEGLEIPVG